MLIPILDSSHGKKTSPDTSITEFEYTQKLVEAINKELHKQGIDSKILVPENVDISLGERTRRANKIFADTGRKTFLVSVHLNTSGANGKWQNPSGWSVFTCSNPVKDSQNLAESLYSAATGQGLQIRKPITLKNFWEQDSYLSKNTLCPCVTTYNLFLDNKTDTDFLKSDEGFLKLVNLHVEGIKEYLKNNS